MRVSTVKVSGFAHKMVRIGPRECMPSTVKVSRAPQARGRSVKVPGSAPPSLELASTSFQLGHDKSQRSPPTAPNTPSREPPSQTPWEFLHSLTGHRPAENGGGGLRVGVCGLCVGLRKVRRDDMRRSASHDSLLSLRRTAERDMRMYAASKDDMRV